MISGSGINRTVVLPRFAFYAIPIETTLCIRYGNVIEIRSIDKQHDDRQITDNRDQDVTLSRPSRTHSASYYHKAS